MVMSLLNAIVMETMEQICPCCLCGMDGILALLGNQKDTGWDLAGVHINIPPGNMLFFNPEMYFSYITLNPFIKPMAKWLQCLVTMFAGLHLDTLPCLNKLVLVDTQYH